jgi:hypothetical protein
MAEVRNEAALEEALENLYQQWGSLGFWAKRIHAWFSPGRAKYIGGIATVRSVLRGRSAGFAFLKKRGCLDLSVENLILKPEWKHLFSDEDRDFARKRLASSSK